MAARPSRRLNTPAMLTERLEATVHGMVQGVGFRFFVMRFAAGHGLVGWVANRSDGSVAVVAEGPRDHLDRLEAALTAGPRGARVTRVDARHLPATGGFAGFEVRASGHRGD